MGNPADYSQEELQEAFDIVKDPEDWKNPIVWVGKMDDDTLACVRAAIIHFTATEARVSDMGDGNLQIEAEGYRMGPCWG